MSGGWAEIYGGKLEFIEDAGEIIARTLAHIDAKRASLGLAAYDPSKFGASGDDRTRELEELPVGARRSAIYGAVG
jgi:hypothetical protein